MKNRSTNRPRAVKCRRLTAYLLPFAFAALLTATSYAEQPPSPCHLNPQAAQDEATVRNRGDVSQLLAPLTNRLAQLANRPHSILPLQVFAEADPPSQLFQYYLLDTSGFEPNVFTKLFPGVNDHVQLTVTGGNCGLPTVGSVRVVLEPKPGLPTDPTNPRAFIDVFTDISGLFVINNESGWYEGWMIHDLTVPTVNSTPRKDGHARFGPILPADAAALKKMGTGNNVPGAVFTLDGNAARPPSANDHFPDKQSNLVPIYLSMGAYNGLQQSDVHSYWEFNYQGTNWVHPLYELPSTGGVPGKFWRAAPTLPDGGDGQGDSTIPRPRPPGRRNNPGASPGTPRPPATPAHS